MEFEPMIAPYSTLGPWDILPERVTLHNEAFTDAFAAFRLREEAAGRKVTYETFSDEAGINERVFRKARTGHGKLPRHQVLKIAERLGCTPSSIVKRSIVEDPDRVAKLKAEDERDRKDMAAWPVPLREVVSWTEFVEHLKMVESARPTWGDDVLSLAAAPAIDAFDAALRYSSQVAKDNPAMAAAALKDAAADLQALDLHVLAGRYVARRDGDHHSYMELVYVLEVWIRREAEDLAHMVDRSSEPMCTTMAENEEDDTDVIDGWLAWEGKRRLSLWRGDDTE
jgi:hypothetical protein